MIDLFLQLRDFWQYTSFLDYTRQCCPSLTSCLFFVARSQHLCLYPKDPTSSRPIPIISGDHKEGPRRSASLDSSLAAS